MNWLYVIVMGYIVVSALRGFHRGFLKVIYSMAALLIAAAFITLTIPVFRNLILNYTTIEKQIETAGENYVRDQAEKKLEEGTWTGNQEIKWLTLPQALQDELENGTKTAILDMLETQKIYQKTAEAIADFCITLIAFFLALVIISLVLFLTGRKLNVFSKKPGIHLANMILGFAAGAAKAFLVIWIVFIMIKATSMFPTSAALIRLIEENAVLRGLYERNRLLELIESLTRNLPQAK